MLRTNRDTLVHSSVVADICVPYTMPMGVDVINYQGRQHTIGGLGGVVYNVAIGDKIFHWQGVDHLEPGVSLKAKEKDAQRALNHLSCIGNQAVIVTAAMHSDDCKLKGKTGVVTGNHAGIDDIHVWFPADVIAHLLPGDKIAIFTNGVGLAMPDYPDIKVQKLDPRLLLAMRIEERDGMLAVPVTHEIPPELMGSGIGTTSTNFGDYDIQASSHDHQIRPELQDMRFGDFVALRDQDCRYGFGYNKGSLTIGIVIHGDSQLAGHGPGVTPLISGTTDSLAVFMDKGANIVHHLDMLSKQQITHT